MMQKPIHKRQNRSIIVMQNMKIITKEKLQVTLFRVLWVFLANFLLLLYRFLAFLLFYKKIQISEKPFNVRYFCFEATKCP